MRTTSEIRKTEIRNFAHQKFARNQHRKVRSELHHHFRQKINSLSFRLSGNSLFLICVQINQAYVTFYNIFRKAQKNTVLGLSPGLWKKVRLWRSLIKTKPCSHFFTSHTRISQTYQIILLINDFTLSSCWFLVCFSEVFFVFLRVLGPIPRALPTKFTRMMVLEASNSNTLHFLINLLGWDLLDSVWRWLMG